MTLGGSSASWDEFGVAVRLPHRGHGLLRDYMSPARHRKLLTVSVSRRRIAAAFAGGLLAVMAAACGALPVTPAPDSVNPAEPSGDDPSPAVAPPAPQPVADGPCPYLSAAAVEAANGQRVGAVRISGTATDRPHPACFFLTTNRTTQVRTWIVVATPKVARATLDAAAPVATSDLVAIPGGWSGGSQPTTEGAVVAVNRQGTTVVVTTNQPQTISARRIAEQVIAALDL
ncbi:MAG: DUF2020 domain-containing protein [Pseudonocardiaceae bacterium]